MWNRILNFLLKLLYLQMLLEILGLRYLLRFDEYSNEKNSYYNTESKQRIVNSNQLEHTQKQSKSIQTFRVQSHTYLRTEEIYFK